LPEPTPPPLRRLVRPQRPPQPQPRPAGASTTFNNFANSAGMQFQLDQGANMINNRYAAPGRCNPARR
jgi:hypothetical protein